MKLQKIFNLKKPVRVIIGKPIWKGESINGLYEWKTNIEYHCIIIHSDNKLHSYEYNNILAHEYIHAWQCEMGLKLSHGKVFKWWAEKLAEYGYRVSKRQ